MNKNTNRVPHFPDHFIPPGGSPLAGKGPMVVLVKNGWPEVGTPGASNPALVSAGLALAVTVPARYGRALYKPAPIEAYSSGQFP